MVNMYKLIDGKEVSKSVKDRIKAQTEPLAKRGQKNNACCYNSGQRQRFESLCQQQEKGL